MAVAAAAARSATGPVTWENKDYEFDPYCLTAEKLHQGHAERTAAGSPHASGKQGGKRAAAAVAQADGRELPVKRRPGRQKRTSVLCQVPGCNEELVDAKKYYRRYRICQLHCNMPRMTIEGRCQRFCQQCGRFHDIDEFEGAKRSCRRKLKRHNERRRSAVTAGAAKKASWRSDTEEEAEEKGEAGAEDSGSDARAASGVKMHVPHGKAPSVPASPAASLAAPAAQSLQPGTHPGTGSHCSDAGADLATGARQLSANAAHSGNAASMALAVSAAVPPSPAQTPPRLEPHQVVHRVDMPPSHSGSMDCSSQVVGEPAAVMPQQRQRLLAVPARVGGSSTAPSARHGVHPCPAIEPQQLNQSSGAKLQQAVQQDVHHQQHQQEANPLTNMGKPSAQTPASMADAELDAVLQQLLRDEDVQQLQVDPLEIFLPPAHAPAATMLADPASQRLQAPPAAPASIAPSAVNGALWDGDQFAPSLDVLPMDLMEDIPLIPLPEELESAGCTAATSSVAASAAFSPLHAGGVAAVPYVGIAAAPTAGSRSLSAHSAFTCGMPAATASAGSVHVAAADLALRRARVEQMLHERQQQARQLRQNQEAARGHMLLLRQVAQQAPSMRRIEVQPQPQAPPFPPPRLVPEVQQQPHSGSAAHAPAAQPQLVPRISRAVLHGAQGLLSVPGVTDSVNAAPVVRYPLQRDRLTSMSLKVFNCTPDQLLPSVRQELEGLLAVGQTLLEGYIRPGCTQLTVNALLGDEHAQELKASGLGGMVTQLLEKCGSGEALGQDMIVQFEGELAVVKRRRLVAILSTRTSPGVVPALALPLPLAVHATASKPAAAVLVLRGRHLGGEADLVLARQQGSYLTVELHASGEVQGKEYARVRVLGALPGWVDLELQHGSFLSRPRPLLVLPSTAAVAEVRQLELDATGVDCVDDMLRDIGLVAQYLCRDELKAGGLPCPAYTPALLASIASKARQLVAAAVARGWAATVELLLPAVTADGSPAAAAAAAMDACCPQGATLLHVAVGTSSVPLMQRLVAWGSAVGFCWAVDACGGAGVTPLHVAAMLPNAADMRDALTAANPATAKLWGLVQAEDGTTPEGLAEAVAAAAARLTAKEVDCKAAEAALASAGAPEEHGSTLIGSCSERTDASVLAPAQSMKASGSKVAEAVSTSKDGPSVASSSARFELVQPVLMAGAEASKAGAKDSLADCCSGQQRRSRNSIKAHLEELHMISMVSEVESRLQADTDRRPLPDPLSGTIAIGAMLLRALGLRGN